MTKTGSRMECTVQGLGRSDIFVPLDKAARIARLLEQVPIEISTSGDCRIEVSDNRMDIYGLDGGLEECRITDPSRITNVSVKNGIILFDVKCEGFSQIAVHSKRHPAPRPSSSYSSTLSSSGESRASPVRSSG